MSRRSVRRSVVGSVTAGERCGNAGTRFRQATVERGERKRTAAEVESGLGDVRTGGDPSSGISSGDALILPEQHPACRRREARPGFVAVASGSFGSSFRLDPDERSVASSAPEAAIKPQSPGQAQVRAGQSGAEGPRPQARCSDRWRHRRGWWRGRRAACISGSHGPSRLTPSAIAHNPSPWLHGRRT